MEIFRAFLFFFGLVAQAQDLCMHPSPVLCSRPNPLALCPPALTPAPRDHAAVARVQATKTQLGQQKKIPTSSTNNSVPEDVDEEGADEVDGRLVDVPRRPVGQVVQPHRGKRLPPTERYSSQFKNNYLAEMYRRARI